MNLETVIAEKVHALPIGKQARVLEFVEDLSVEESNGRETRKDEKVDSEKKVKRLSVIGMFSSGSTDISERAEEILAEEIDERSGWTLKEKIIAD